MKLSLVPLLLCGMLLTFGRCTREELSHEEPATHQPLRVLAEAPAFVDPSDTVATRTPIESGLETLFSKGDAIGIFAVKEGAIANGVDNLRLTFIKTSLTTGEWNPPAGKDLYWSEGVSYIAYYPYKEGITVDAAQTPADILAALSGNDLLKPSSDQSAPENYAASDLMTALGVVTQQEGSTIKVLKFTLAHQHALVVLKPQARFNYVAPAGAAFAYRGNAQSALTVDVTARDVLVDGIKACKMDDGSYRAIVPPTDTPARIEGTYTTHDVAAREDVAVHYAGSQTVLGRGSCHTLTVNSPLPTTERVRDLAPGDFVFYENNRIEIFPGDGAFTGETIPDASKALGMVITCDPAKMTDPECNKQGWDHAYVMGLVNLPDGRWGDPAVNEPLLTEMTQYKAIEDNMNGYSETQAILTAHADDLSRYIAFKNVQDHRAKNLLPSGVCSPWFLPSIGQWCDMLTNICGRSPRSFPTSSQGLEDHQYGTETKQKIDKQLAKVGSTLGSMINYRYIFQCSSEYDTGKSWILIWHFEKMSEDTEFWDRIGVKGYQKDALSSYHVRPFFAF